MADNETITDIIAEKRRRADEIERDCAAKMKSGRVSGDRFARELVEGFRKEADRLEAAHRRERGNAAKLREALENLYDQICHGETEQHVAANRQMIRAALAEPPRNCDIYLTEEAVDAATVTVRDCKACSRLDMEAPCVFCMVRWLLAPATEKEGASYGNE